MQNPHIYFFSPFKEVEIVKNFFPLLYVRRLEELIVGARSLKERVETQIGATLLNGYYLFSKHAILSDHIIKKILESRENTLWKTYDGIVVAAFVKKMEDFVPMEYDFPLSRLVSMEWEEEYVVSLEDVHYLAFVEDIINIHETCLYQDLLAIKNRAFFADDVMVHEGARVHPTAVLDTSEGPIVIGENAEIQALSYIAGPSYIGAGTQIYQGKIRASYIGKDCRIGGEVGQSVILSYTNKAHEGFVGHSYIGSWVNLGALFTTSDLKNNYKSVVLEYEQKTRDSHLLKLGSLIGDFTTLSIGTLLNTGTSVGIGCNIADPRNFLPKYVPSFSWKDGKKDSIYRYKDFLETLKHRMKRRDCTVSSHEEELLQKLHQTVISEAGRES